MTPQTALATPVATATLPTIQVHAPRPAATPSAPIEPPAPVTHEPGVLPSDLYNQQADAISALTQQLISEQDDPGPQAPPDLFMPPPPTPPPFNPIHAWASNAMVFAAIGSLLTRSPLTTAMNAAADVVNAYKSNNAAAAKQAFDTWQTQTANALKLHEFELKQYTDAINSHSNNERAQAATLLALATSFKDAEPINAAYNSGGLPGVVTFLGKRGRAAAKVAQTSADLTDFQNESVAYSNAVAKLGPRPTDPQAAQTYDIRLGAIKGQIFKKTYQQAGTDPADIPGPTGFSDNDYLEAARSYLAGGKGLTYPSGNLGKAMKAKFDHALIEAEKERDGSGGAGSSSGGSSSDNVQLSVQSIQTLGEEYAKGAPISQLVSGMGKNSGSARIAIINAGTAYLLSHGGSADTLLANDADFKANQASLDQQTKAANASAQYEQTAVENIKLAQSLMPAGVPTDISPVLNAIAQGASIQAGAPGVPAYAAALETALAEYAKVMSGGTGSAVASSDSARQAAESLLQRGYTGQQADAVFQVMIAEMANRQNAYQQTIDYINSKIASSGSADGSIGDGSAPAPSSAASSKTTSTGVTFSVSQ